MQEPELTDRSGERTISLLDIVAVLVRRKLLIFLFTIIVAAVLVAFAFATKSLPPDHPLNFLPDVFRPRVEVLLQESGGGADSLGSLLSQSGLGSVMGLLGSAGSLGTSAELAQHLLDSDVIKDRIARDFDFVTRYGITKYPRSSARGIIGSALEFEYDAGPGVLSITYRDTDREFATEVVNRTVEILEEEFRAITLRRVSDKRANLEKRLQGSEDEMAAAKQALIDYSVEHGIVDIEEQASAAAEQQAGLNSQLLGKQLERNNLLKGGRSVDDPLLRRLQDDIDELNRLLGEMRSGFTTYAPVTIPENQLPRIISEYVDLKYEVTLRQAVYTSLRQSLEMALLDEKDQTNLFQVLERAEVPELKSGPSRSKICVIGTVAAFFVAVFLAFVREYVDRLKRDPGESRKLSDIRRMLRFRKG